MLRKVIMSTVVASIFVLTGCKGGGDMKMSEMKKPALPPELKKLESWVGHWEAESTMYAGGDKSKPMTHKSTSKAEWVLDGMYLKESFEGEMGEMGKMTGALIHWYDPQCKVYRSTYFDNWGHTGEGTMTYNERKGSWKMKWEGNSLDGTKTHGEGTMTMVDNNTITWNMTEWAGWKKLWEGTSTAKRK